MASKKGRYSVSGEKRRTFRGLNSDFIRELKEGELHCILEFERKYRKSFMVKIRNEFLDLYFLGHDVEVKRKKADRPLEFKLNIWDHYLDSLEIPI